MKRLSLAFIFVILLSVFSLFEGCLSPDFTFIEPKDAFNSSLQGSEALSLEAYRTTVYPLVRRNCAGCHSSIQSPFFAAANSERAHSELLQSGKVNFQDIPNSRLIQRLSLDQHNCWKDCQSAASDIQAAIQSWSDQRGAWNLNLKVTAKKLVPANLGTQTTTLSFPIDSIFSPSLKGATFEISVVKFDNFSYRFFSPTIKTSASTLIYVKEVSILINGILSPSATTYRLIDQVVTGTSGGVSLSTASMILELDNGPGKDQISISFSELTRGDGASLAQARFNSVLTTIQTQCASCHTSGQTDRPLFAAYTTEAQFLAATWNGAPLISKGNADGSLLYQVVGGTTPPAMPPNASSATRTSIAATLKAWINGIP